MHQYQRDHLDTLEGKVNLRAHKTECVCVYVTNSGICIAMFWGTVEDRKRKLGTLESDPYFVQMLALLLPCWVMLDKLLCFCDPLSSHPKDARK